ncbi:MAG TPA: hypothetical protein VL486_04400 [Verrucomicrobiae bacterium]|nr:hypothetical protein [Verrucomicrobiae bacterium]
MKIENLREERTGDRARIAATIKWEDCDRPTRDVYFETTTEFAGALCCSVEPFVLAGVLPALWYGEQRLHADGEICPDMRNGVITAMSVIRHWYGLKRGLVRIEAPSRSRPLADSVVPRAGFFATGGVDSLATLRGNRLNFPPSHPGSIRDGVVIFGLEVEDAAAFELVLKLLRSLAGAADFTLVPVYTNERYLEPDWGFWIDVFEGAVLAAVGHALRRRLTEISIASSFDIANLHHLASHPMLDPFYSGHELRIHHDSAALSRLEKTRLLADWDVALRHLRVCNAVEHYQAGRLNCGRCEKCLRTMIALLIAGKLDQTHVFQQTELSEELVREVAVLGRTNFRFWPELIAPLEQMGRHDLARGVRYALDRYEGGLGWKGALRRFDRRRLNGVLYSLRRAIRNGS